MNLLSKIFGCNKKPEHPLYMYVTTFTVTNEHLRIVESMSFKQKMEDKEKKRIRRCLLKLNPNCTVNVRGRYYRYN